MNREDDLFQRQLALDPMQSFIVQAPAGSGKTELLIQRHLVLLSTVNEPEEIIAITFTKKAASEMRTRLIQALKSALENPEPDSNHAKLTWRLAKKVIERDQALTWHLIENPNRLRIQTIDSLCAHLTKQLPLLSQFGSQPDITDNPLFLYRESVYEILAHVEENDEWSQAIADLLLHLDNDLNKLHTLLVNLLSKRDQWLPYIHLDKDEKLIRAQLEKSLVLIIQDALIKVHQLFPKNLSADLISVAQFASNQLKNLENITQLPGKNPEDKEAWLGIAELLLTKDHTFRKRFDRKVGFPPEKEIKNKSEKMLIAEYRNKLKNIIDDLSEHDDIRYALSELFSLPNLNYDENQWQVLKSLLSVLKIAAAQLRLLFQIHGKIDYIENTQAALTALGDEGEPTNLILALDYQIKHLLVDEFQDTSYNQYRLLEKLTSGWEENDGRTLFIVGDPMQSIYRFREAEVGLFLRTRDHGLGAIPLTSLTLSLNFRSNPTIIDWVNFHFLALFPKFNDMAAGAVTYSPSIASKAFSSDADIKIQGFVNAPPEIQAEAIVDLIQSQMKMHPDDTIAILVRSRSHLEHIIAKLKKATIPYSALDIDPLSERQIIQDLFSLTGALLHPADRIAWLALLRAPWCGLSLADLLVIAGESSHAAIWEQLENQKLISQLSADGQMRLASLLPILKMKLAERERFPLRHWIESTWLLLGGPAGVQSEMDLEDANAFFQLLASIEQDTAQFNLTSLKEKINRLYASCHHADHRLQIMTIHTAKGLEFDTVILPHIERRIPPNDKPLLSWMEQPLSNDNSALLLAPIHGLGQEKDLIYEYIHSQESIKSNYETDRLLYVAATRAKKRLHLFFNIETNIKNEIGNPNANTFLEKLWPCLQNDLHSILVKDESEMSPLVEKPSRYLKRLISNWKNPVHETRIYDIAHHTNQTGFKLQDAKYKIVGSTIHRIIQEICNHKNPWKEKSREHQDLFLKTILIQQGLMPIDLKASIQAIHHALDNLLTDERGLWIIKPHLEAQSELAMTAVIEGDIKNLIIDRTFVDENGVRFIIDFKTSHFMGDDLEVFLKTEKEKHGAQLQQYAQAMRLIEKRPIRLGLYFPSVPAWCEWEG